ncbi:ATPase, F0/V0 complex, subunit C protein [Actinidia rufa]|uniref:V-type proton ATPase proteolipid subunit n=1 Tax=Actinidia rufa TaxID=165716 RepID=A0A7J0FD70_9ERIC|nr:ATPase, F0/V0 complex, subunit C protein [Actinidia rufa]
MKRHRFFGFLGAAAALVFSSALVTMEDLIYLDPFPSDVPTEEYSSTITITDIPLLTTFPEDTRAASPIPSFSSVAPSSDSGNPDLPAHRYPIRSRHPPGMGAAYGTAKSGVGVASMGVMRPELVMKSIVPVVMAGVLGIYGLIIAVIISTGINPKAKSYYLFDGYAHLSSGLACGLAGLSAGMAIGIVGDAGVR